MERRRGGFRREGGPARLACAALLLAIATALALAAPGNTTPQTQAATPPPAPGVSSTSPTSPAATPSLTAAPSSLPSAPDPLVGPNCFFFNLYGDRKATKPGDILHIIIAEQASATNAASRNLQRTSSTSAGPGQGLLDFLKAVGYQGSSAAKDSATAVRSGSLTARVTVTVIRTLPDGNLFVEGKHDIQVNKDHQTITLRGEVRPRDVSADNTVYSYDVANLQVEYAGSDPARPGKRMGFLGRILNALF